MRLARQIQKDLGDILLKEGPQIFGSTFISVSTVRLSPDLSFAKVYVTFIKEENPQKVVDEMNARKGELRHKLGEKLRSHVRKIPELDFQYDDTMDYVEKIDKLFDKIKKEDEKGPDQGEQ